MKSVNLDIFYQAEPFTIHRMPEKTGTTQINTCTGGCTAAQS